MTGALGGDTVTERTRLLLEGVLRQAEFPGGDELLRQASSVRVVGGPITMLDLRPGDASAASVFADGPIPLRALVSDGSGDLIGEILIWVEHGYLSGLEFAWWTDDAPHELPIADHVTVTRQ